MAFAPSWLDNWPNIRFLAMLPPALLLYLTLASTPFTDARDDLAVNEERIENFLMAQGLPSNSLQSSLTDKQGFLWVAGDQGLARFDGRTWRIFDRSNTPAIRSAEARKLFLRRNGSLLLSMANGDLLEWHDERWERIAEFDSAVGYFLELDEGSILLGGEQLTRLAMDGRVTQIISRNQSNAFVRAVAVDGRAIALTMRGELFEFDIASGLRPLGALPEFENGEAAAMFASGNALWIFKPEQRWHFDLTTQQVTRHKLALPMRPTEVEQSPDGQFWMSGFSATNAVCRLDSLSSESCESVALDAKNITDISLDRHGALWLTTWGNGLFRVTRPPITQIAAESGRVRSMAALRDGRVLWHNNRSSYVASSSSSSSARTALQASASYSIRPWTPMRSQTDSALALLELADGRILRGRHGNVDLASEDLSRWQGFSARLEAPHPKDVYALFQDRSGVIWSLSSNQVWRYTDATTGWQATQSNIRQGYAFTEARDGTLWAATLGGAFRKNASGQFVDGGAPKPAGPFILMSAFTDSRGHLWFGGYECGVYRFDGRRWLHLDRSRGLPEDTAYGIQEDADQRLWISHGRGLYTLSLVEAERAARDAAYQTNTRQYTSSDGLAIAGFNGGGGVAAVKDTDGMLWFASDYGTIRVDPTRLPEPIKPVQLVLENLSLDGVAVAPIATAQRTQLMLPAGTQSLALTLSAPAAGVAQRVSIRYRLEPLERDWLTLADQAALNYQRLTPGQYHLRAQVGVDQEHWIDQLNLAIVQAPFWWQRGLSWLLICGVSIVLGALLVRWRLTALRRRNLGLEALVQSRGESLASALQQSHELQAQQVESQRELDWLKRHRALDQWAQIDAIARVVYLVVARANQGIAVQGVMHVLDSDVCQERRWTTAEINAALLRLQGHSAVFVAKEIWRPTQSDWALLPEFDAPLALWIARASPRVGAFALLERIGEGAMGEVFRASNVHDGSIAAVKLVHRDVSHLPEARQRLQREGEIVGALNHPNIVRLYERGEHDGRLYLAMQFLPGQTLAERLASHSQLPRADAINVLAGIAIALSELHQCGVIHRDLHPGNVMVLEHTHEGTPTPSSVLLDFGLARSVADIVSSKSKALMGNLPYIAPELLSGQPASCASDVFAMGVIAFEMLSHRRFWHSSGTLELVAEMARFSSLECDLAELPEFARADVRDMLSAAPDERSSAREAVVQMQLWARA